MTGVVYVYTVDVSYDLSYYSLETDKMFDDAVGQMSDSGAGWGKRDLSYMFDSPENQEHALDSLRTLRDQHPEMDIEITEDCWEDK